MENRYSLDDVQNIAKALIGKTFGELNNYKVQAELFGKGSFGHILEEDVFQYGKNSRSAPDFENIGVELKVTPYKINKDGSLSAKERLVLNIINYMEEYKYDFYNSHFWYKNKMIQLVWYLYEEGKPKTEFKITNELLFTFPQDDLPIIIQDWNTIIDKIKAGKAHEISEADTLYLGACTKGVNSDSVRKQPFSDIMAKQRAFCLKTSYMSELVRSYIGGKKLENSIDKTQLINKSFFEIIYDKVKNYFGMSQQQLKEIFNVDSNAKNINELLICKMFNIKSDLGKTDEFVKANIIPRTIRVQYNGNIKESLPFPAFKYKELVEETWDDSDLRNTLITTKYLFFVFKERKGEYYFEKIKLWNISLNELDSYVKKVWEETKTIVSEGRIVSYVSEDGKRKTNFPGMKDNYICHVRPHARDSKDCYELPVIDVETGEKKYTKHSFWINATYLAKIVGE